MGGLRRFVAGVATIAPVMALVGCSQMSNPSFDLRATDCRATTANVLRVLDERLDVSGAFRHGGQIEMSDGTFVSAELHRSGDDKDVRGDIFTFRTDSLDSGDFQAVDVHAREDTSWPPASIDVRSPGARESRACVLPNVGKSRARVQCEHDQQSADIQADRHCDEL